MTLRTRNIHKAFLFIILSLLIGACAPEKATEEAESVSSAPAIPDDEQLVEIGVQKLKDWSGHWQSKGANPGDFRLVQKHNYEPLELPSENTLQENNPLRDYQIHHPTAEGVVDIYGYKIEIGEEQRVSFNPDSEVVYYRTDGMRERLLFIGPSGVFEDAVWVSEDHLLVAGHMQTEAGFEPVLWLINPEEREYSVFESNFSTQAYAPESFLKVKLKGLDFSS